MLENLHKISVDDHEARKRTLKSILKDNCLPYLSQGGYSADKEVENIIVRFGSSKKRLVIGAHYDNVEGSTGANDNATGVCILIELAKTLRIIPHSVQIDIVFFDWEEIGGLGAELYVKKTGAESILAMINLDICGVGEKILTAPDKNASLPPFAEAFASSEMSRHYYEIITKLPNGDEQIFERHYVPNISVGILPEEDVEAMKTLFTSDKEVKKEDFPSIIETMHNGPRDNVDVVEPDAMLKVYEFTLSLATLMAK